jgi:nicotinamide riboside transporter PnuC
MNHARLVAALMAVAATSLAVMSSLHFSGALNGSKPFDPTRAGIAEALVGAVLLVGAVGLWRRWTHGWAVVVAANIFAVVGFVIGLTRTFQGGSAIDVGYHVTVLPLLVLTLLVLGRGSIPKAEHAT